MTADLLRRAAAKIRETAKDANPGPWWANPIATEAEVDVYSGTGSSEDIAVADGAYRADAEHIAMWSPDVAELVAAWLDSEDRAFIVAIDSPAATLARRILGEQP